MEEAILITFECLTIEKVLSCVQGATKKSIFLFINNQYNVKSLEPTFLSSILCSLGSLSTNLLSAASIFDIFAAFSRYAITLSTTCTR